MNARGTGRQGTKRIIAGIVTGMLALGTLSGCAQQGAGLALAAEESQVQLRAIQQRWFETGDTSQVLRGTIATLQDLGFVIDKADNDLGTVSGTKIAGQSIALKITVTVRTLSEARTLVRANVQYGLERVEEPGPYQSFFASLGKGLFLEAHALD